MTVDRIDPGLVEKVAKAIEPYLFAQKPHRGPAAIGVAEAVTRVFFDELRLKKEHREPPAGTSTRIHGQFRYVSDWISVDQLGRPVEQGGADGD